jgi:hypothetical protein
VTDRRGASTNDFCTSYAASFIHGRSHLRQTIPETDKGSAAAATSKSAPRYHHADATLAHQILPAEKSLEKSVDFAGMTSFPKNGIPVYGGGLCYYGSASTLGDLALYSLQPQHAALISLPEAK